MEVLAFTVNQGLYHPLQVSSGGETRADQQCMPILISLETSDDAFVSERALALHATLHSKHSSLVNVRYLDFAKAAYDYQRSLSAEVSGQRDGFALLSGWYGLLGEKRSWRHEFLRALGRAFDYEAGPSHSVSNVRNVETAYMAWTDLDRLTLALSSSWRTIWPRWTTSCKRKS